ncbi:hypothetical protein CR203_22815 [Salipaludibacillus neizhouensis]|uniref:Uncharacterized protein n=1 Tax=Salipaludibacillus neizhouensis TaxID=885475 RepID=A0A3A9K3H7_9BACI|nr:hypothetical protein CR203_22815 [Salipaludibacillus neizhouensis]
MKEMDEEELYRWMVVGRCFGGKHQQERQSWSGGLLIWLFSKRLLLSKRYDSPRFQQSDAYRRGTLQSNTSKGRDS